MFTRMARTLTAAATDSSAADRADAGGSAPVEGGTGRLRLLPEG